MRIPALLRSVQKTHSFGILQAPTIYLFLLHYYTMHNNEIPGPFAGDAARMNCIIIISHSHCDWWLSPRGQDLGFLCPA
jgi:hypothetical protein